MKDRQDKRTRPAAAVAAALGFAVAVVVIVERKRRRAMDTLEELPLPWERVVPDLARGQVVSEAATFVRAYRLYCLNQTTPLAGRRVRAALEDLDRAAKAYAWSVARVNAAGGRKAIELATRLVQAAPRGETQGDFVAELEAIAARLRRRHYLIENGVLERPELREVRGHDGRLLSWGLMAGAVPRYTPHDGGNVVMVEPVGEGQIRLTQGYLTWVVDGDDLIATVTRHEERGGLRAHVTTASSLELSLPPGPQGVPVLFNLYLTRQEADALVPVVQEMLRR